MADVDVNIAGIEQVLANFQRLDDAMKNKISRKAVGVGAQVILNSARPLAPVRTGTLLDSILIRTWNRPAKGFFRASTGVGAEDYKGPTFYAPFVLWGHLAGNRRLGDRRKHVAGHDFLKETAQSAGQRAAEAMMQVIEQEIANLKGE